MTVSDILHVQSIKPSYRLSEHESMIYIKEGIYCITEVSLKKQENALMGVISLVILLVNFFHLFGCLATVII